MQYSQLPKQYKFINPVGLPEQLRIATKRHFVDKRVQAHNGQWMMFYKDVNNESNTF
ncbi:hypothetical protein ACRWQN_12855 [Shewanella sp. HL-SH8]|uniref:hypothetical protein n=1 Tax=Shewanella sp. HL-SH8 TaxID=3436242 RepID=UPI003EB99B5C